MKKKCFTSSLLLLAAMFLTSCSEHDNPVVDTPNNPVVDTPDNPVEDVPETAEDVDSLIYGNFIGCFLNKDGSITTTKQTSGSNESFAVIVYTGAIKGYCDNFLALALENTDFVDTWEESFDAVDNYAATHPITIQGITYNTNAGGHTYYDIVTNDLSVSSASRSGDAVKGWRMPSITDWRYIISSFCDDAPSPDSPIGIVAGTYYDGTNTFRNEINLACGNFEFGLLAYWTSSQLYDEVYATHDNDPSEYAWCYRDCNEFEYYKKWSGGFIVRPVFAY